MEDGGYVVLNLEGVELLIQLLDKDYFDEGLFNKFIRLKQMKAFLRHERELNRSTNKSILKNELKKVIFKKDYKDLYNYHVLKKNLPLLKRHVRYIKDNQDDIIKNALEKVYKIVPKDVKINPKIYIIVGGQDGGFTILMNSVYINLGKYLGYKEEFVDILAHELYHGRKIKFHKKIHLIFKMNMAKEKPLFETLGRIFEEGIACLIQHGKNLSKDDPVGTLTKRKLILFKKDFKNLDKALLSIKKGNPNYKLISSLDVYVLGYKMVKVLYKERGVSILNEWTINYDHKKLIKEYVTICYEKNTPTGFSKEVDNWLLML